MKQIINYSERKLLVVLFAGVLLLSLSKLSNAQMSYGLKLGTGVACQSDLLELANNCDVRFSPSIGLVGKYQFSDGFALKSGIEYQPKGRNFTKANADMENKLQYLTLPLKVVFSAGEKAGFKNGQRIFFSVGPYLSYMLDASGKLDNAEFNLNSDTKDFDAGLGLELGIEYPVFNENALQIGLNYDMGFVEVYKSTPDLHNKMASLSLALFF